MPKKLAVPENVTASPRDSAVDVSWDPIKDAGGYILRFYAADKPKRCIKKRYASTAEKSVFGFVNGREYLVEISTFRHENGEEIESERSEAVSFTPVSEELKAQNVICLSTGEYTNMKWERGNKTPMASFKSSNSDVAVVDGGLVRATGKGCAKITTISQGKSVVTKVYVDREQPKPDASAVMLFAGDIMCTARQQRAAEKRSYDFGACFSHIRAQLKSADLCCGALNTACCDAMPYELEQPRNEEGSPNNNAPSSLLSALSGAGFGMLATSNGHCCSLGEKGLKATAAEIARVGMDNLGTLKANPVFHRVKGFRVAFIGCNMLSDGEAAFGAYSRERFSEYIRKSRAAGAEYIVVFAHWGDINTEDLNSVQLEESRFMADAGADLIVGSHPHIVQKYELITASDGRAVHCAYSLGNFLTSYSEIPENRDSAVLRVVLSRRNDGISAKVSYIPCVCEGMGGDVRVLPVQRVYSSDSREAKERIAAQIGDDIRPFSPKPEIALSGSSILGRIFDYGGRFCTHKTAMRLSQLGTDGIGYVADDVSEPVRIDIEKDYMNYFRTCGAEYVAVDFYTAATAVLYKRETELYTGSTRFLQAPFYTIRSEEFKRIKPPFKERLWKTRIKSYAEELLKIFPPERIILVRQRISEKTAFDGELRLIRRRDALNERLAAMEDYFIELTDPCVIDLARCYFGRNGSPLHFEREYYNDASEAAMKIIEGGRRYVTEPDSGLWYDRVMRYYNSMTTGAKQRWLLDMRSAADMLIAYTNMDFAAKYRTWLMKLKACGESRLDMVRGFFADDRAAAKLCDAADIIHAVLAGDISRPYDFYAPAFREDMNIVKVMAKLLSAQLSGPVSAKSAELVMLLRDDPDMLNAYFTGLPNRTVDIWGSDISKEIVNADIYAETGKYIFMQNPVLSYEPLMSVKIPQDDAGFGGSSWRRRAAEDAFARNGLFQLSKSSSKWLVVDFYDLICEMNEYNGGLFEVDEFFRSTEFYKSIKDECESCYLFEKRDLNHCREALMRFTQDISYRYGGNIILVRVDLKQDYIDTENRLQKLPEDPKLQFKRRFISVCEDMFIKFTDCYVIDVAKRYYASDSHHGGADIARYEAEFYRQAAEHMTHIMSGYSKKLYDQVDERYMVFRDLRLGRK